MKKAVAEFEAQRLALQDVLDGQLEPAVRNRMGQFATPTGLAVDIQRYAKMHFNEGERVRFIDPAIGTGAFYSALLDVFPRTRIGTAVGYEIDPHYGRPAARLWGAAGLDMRLEDFTRAAAPVPCERFNLLICNPPYVRHHHIANGDKQRLKMRTRGACGMDINGLAGLYCYFLGLSHEWMADDGLAGWLIPSEFMDVNYGVSVRRYLLDKVTLLHIHRFDPNDVQFGDALVSSAVVWFRNKPPPLAWNVRFTFGGTLEQPKLERFVSVDALRHDPKWTRYPMKKAHKAVNGPVLGDFFKIKRGLATGDNSYFILSEQDIERRGLPIDAFKPILPSSRYVPDDEIMCDGDGNPLLERRLFLLDPPWVENEIRERYPNLWMYLEQGKAEGIANRYICRHRAMWYTQERRPPAPFVCTYLGRRDKKSGRPFRFILNNSKATAANVYLMLYPREPLERALLDSPALKRRVWEYLNQICPQAMLGEGRVYGGGLHKLEPKELGNVPAEALVELFPALRWQRMGRQGELFEGSVV
ncbi:MAG: SAM-dependent DNA methyltransferase [Gammaproteobacteria bacterium]|nr:SAM-dependent DNA methyltransferase [Gammaproteobacteria bacterium]